jgi:hypothetical protein
MSHQGQPKECHAKVLISQVQFKKLIALCGGDLVPLCDVAGVTCQVSEPGMYFPGTEERIMSFSGPLLHICVAIQALTELFKFMSSDERPGTSNGYALITLNLIVPNSVVGMIMGKGGKDIRNLATDNSVRIQISERIPGLLERMVSVSGRYDHVSTASYVLIETIQADHRTAEHSKILDYPSGRVETPLNEMTKQLDEIVNQLAQFSLIFRN